MASADDAELRRWVEQQLHDLVGFSDRTTANFLVATARRAVPPSASSASANVGAAAVERALLSADVGLSASPALSRFAAEMAARLVGGGSGAGRPQQQQQQQQQPSKKKQQQQYGLLLAGDDEEAEEEAAAAAAAAAAEAEEERRRRESSSSKRRQVEEQGGGSGGGGGRASTKRFRRRRTASPSEDFEEEQAEQEEHEGAAADDDAEAAAAKQQQPPPKEEEEPEEDEEARREREREADRRERAEFEERLRSRDAAHTKRVGGGKGGGGKGGAAAAADPNADPSTQPTQDLASLVPQLRDMSRQEYLRQREERKLRELKEELEDAERLFAGEKLTKKEQADLEYKRRVYELAVARRQELARAEAAAVGGYRLPAGAEELEKAEAAAARQHGGGVDGRLKAAAERYNRQEGAGGVVGGDGLGGQAGADAGAGLGEQERWEREQLAKAGALGRGGGGGAGAGGGGGAAGGSLDAVAAAEKEREERYQLLLDDAVDYVAHGTIPGEDDDDEGTSSEGGGGGERRRRRRRDDDHHKSSRGRVDADAADDDTTKPNTAAPQDAPTVETPAEKMARDRAALPVFPYRQQLLDAVASHQVLILVAETGAGKTTQVPQYLLEAGYGRLGKIGCTQPRRVAAMSVAARVAHERGSRLGQEVGYSVRFEDCTSDKTVLKYMTDGMLLREFLSEPDLASYSVMMVDEAHERTLSTDVLFGLVKDVARFRPDLRLLISSATLDAEKFSDYFDQAPIFKIPGRRFPVDVFFAKQPEADYVDAAVSTALKVHASEPKGDILVFLTGQDEIEAAEELIKQRTRGLGSKIAELVVAPIYAALPTELQARVFEPAPENGRKIVLATNIAETSLTIDGIRYVIDPGFAKVNAFSARTGMESLLVTPISRASASQRAGRAGRTSAGKCFRIYTAWAFENEMDDNSTPEIQRVNLANVVLLLKSLGVHDLVNFDFMDPPPAEALLRALEQLYALGALSDRGELTKLGRRMAEFPLDPQLSKSLLAAEAFGVAGSVATVCAMVSAGGAVFYRPKEKAVHADNARKAFARGSKGDHVALLRVYEGWQESGYSAQWCFDSYVQLRTMRRARDVKEQLVALMERVEIDVLGAASSRQGDDDAVRKAILAGYFYHAARLQRDGTSYRTLKPPRATVALHPSSALKEQEPPPKWVVYHELVLTSREFMRIVSEIKSGWLVEVAPHYYSAEDVEEGGGKRGGGGGAGAARGRGKAAAG
jgi:pre-mRNA-splicing factor ATP-dependent RNA helicase DHX16